MKSNRSRPLLALAGLTLGMSLNGLHAETPSPVDAPPALAAAAERWTYRTDESIDILLDSSQPDSERVLEIRALPAEHSMLRETLLIGQRRKLSEMEQAYVAETTAALPAQKPATVLIEAGLDPVRAEVPNTGLPVLMSVPVSADGSAHIPAQTLPPGVYEVRLPASDSSAEALVRSLTVRAPLDHGDFIMRGTDLHATYTNHRELFQMPSARLNTIQAHYRSAEGADSLAALGFEGVNCSIQPKADPSWKPLKTDGEDARRQFYNVSFNNRDSMTGMSEYVQGEGRAQITHPFNSTSLTINEVTDMVQLDYSPAAQAAWTEYLENTYGDIATLKSDWGAESDTSLTSFETVPMPVPPGGVGGSFNTHLMMDRVDQDVADEGANTTQPDWIRAAWWQWLQFKDFSMRDWLAHAKGEYDKAGALASGDKFIHPHHDPGITFRCNWFVLSKPTDTLFTYDSYNPTWRFGAYFADLASQLNPHPWVLETNKLGGPPAEAAAELFSLYAHGLTGVAFFKWQPYKEGPYYFGFLDPDWTPGAKFDSLAAMYSLSEQTAPSLLKLRTERSPVAVIYPYSDLAQNTARDWALLRNWHAFYATFTERHIVPHIISEQFADAPIPDWIKVVILADVNHVAPAVWERLDSWVRNDGGTLILAGRTGEYDRYARESSALSDKFQYEIGDKKLPRASITADSLSANVFRTGEWFIQEGVFKRTSPELVDVRPQGDQWNTLRTVNMNNVALMERTLGKGQVIVLPWSPGSGFREVAAAGSLRKFWFELLAEHGIAPNLQVSPTDTELDAVLRIGDEGQAMFVAGANHGEAHNYTFSVPAPTAVPLRAIRYNGDTTTDLPLHIDAENATVSFELQLDTFETYAVSLFPADAKPELRELPNQSGVAVSGAGLPWTLNVTDAQGLTLSRPQHGVGAAEVSWPEYDLAKRPFTISLTTPLGVVELTQR